MKWLKLYTEILDDPKIRLLAFEDRWHYVALLCCKAEGIQDERDGIWERLLRVKLGLAEVEFDSLKNRLLEVCLIDENWNPTGWYKRQSAKDSTGAERQKRYREKLQKRDTNVSDALVTDSVTDSVTGVSRVEDRNKNIEVEDRNKTKEIWTKRKRFIPPTVEEVAARCLELGYTVNPERFIAHYSANGWKVGRNAMKCWKSALTGWQTRENEKAQPLTTAQPKETAAQRMRRRVAEMEANAERVIP